MGYLYLAVAVIAGITKGVCGKKLSLKISGAGQTFFVSAVRMAVCVLISGVAAVVQGGKMQFCFEFFAVSFLSGLAVSIFTVTWLIAVQNGSYVLINVFNISGVCVPVVLSAVFFGETVKLTQILGIAFLLVSVCFLCSYNNKIKKKLTLLTVVLLIVCGAANGLTDFSQKLFVHTFPDSSVAVFNFYSYAFSLILLLAFSCFFKTKKYGVSQKNNGKAIKSTAVLIIIMSFSLFVNAYFKTFAAKFLPVAVLYPLNQGITLVFSAVIATILFDEKLTLKSIIGIIFAVVGIIINVS